MRKSGGYSGAVVLIAAIFASTFVIETVRPTEAMPNFAQAYGMNCEVCHTVAPALNAYGRYVQRTHYMSLDASTIHRAYPIWIGESVFYDTQDPAEPHIVQWGNLALHGAGYIGSDLTFHVHQWLWQGDVPGGTDTMWITYDNLFHRDAHLSIGKIEAPAPSPFSQWFDLTGFAQPQITVGEHAYQLDANRWGASLIYVREWFTATAAWLGNNGDLNTATDFSSDIDKSFQWRLAYAHPNRPMEAGFFGTTGVAPVSNGSDRYNATDAYVEIDPTEHLPGLFTMYQIGHDANPGTGFSPSTSHAFTAEVYQPLFRRQAMIAVRDEVTDDGLGTVTHSGNIDFAAVLSRHVDERNGHGLVRNLEAGMLQGGPPAWRAQLSYFTTFGPLR